MLQEKSRLSRQLSAQAVKYLRKIGFCDKKRKREGEIGRPGDGATGRRGDGATGRQGDGARERLGEIVIEKYF
jgi:hypothetical protein